MAVSIGKVLPPISSIWDVKKGLCIDPRRSDAVYTEIIEVYNGIDAASEVSWIIVSRFTAGEGSTLIV